MEIKQYSWKSSDKARYLVGANNFENGNKFGQRLTYLQSSSDEEQSPIKLNLKRPSHDKFTVNKCKRKKVSISDTPVAHKEKKHCQNLNSWVDIPRNEENSRIATPVHQKHRTFNNATCTSFKRNENSQDHTKEFHKLENLDDKLISIIKRLEREKSDNLKQVRSSDSTSGTNYENQDLRQDNSKRKYEQIKKSFQELLEALKTKDDCKENDDNNTEKNMSPTRSSCDFKQTQLNTYFKQKKQNHNNTTRNITFNHKRGNAAMDSNSDNFYQLQENSTMRRELKKREIKANQLQNIKPSREDQSLINIIRKLEAQRNSSSFEDSLLKSEPKEIVTNSKNNNKSFCKTENIVDQKNIVKETSHKSNSLLESKQDSVSFTLNHLTKSLETDGGSKILDKKMNGKPQLKQCSLSEILKKYERNNKNQMQRKEKHQDIKKIKLSNNSREPFEIINSVSSDKSSEEYKNLINSNNDFNETVKSSKECLEKLTQENLSESTYSKNAKNPISFTSSHKKNIMADSTKSLETIVDATFFINNSPSENSYKKSKEKPQIKQCHLSELLKRFERDKKNQMQRKEDILEMKIEKNWNTTNRHNIADKSFVKSEEKNLINSNDNFDETVTSSKVRFGILKEEKYDDLTTENIIIPKEDTQERTEKSKDKFDLSPNTEQCYMEKLNRMYSEIIQDSLNVIKGNYVTKETSEQSKNTTESVGTNITNNFERQTTNENIILGCDNLPKLNEFRSAKNKELDELSSSTVENDGIAKMKDEQTYEEKCVEVIKEKIENVPCLDQLLKEILSEDLLETQHDKSNTELHIETENVISCSQINEVDNILHGDHILKQITEEIRRYNSQPKEIIEDGTYGIKDFVHNLPKLFEERKPYIKRYRKGATKIYRIGKLRKKKEANEGCSPDFDSVIEKMSQSYYGTIKRNKSQASESSVSTNSSYVTDETRSEVLSRGSIELTSSEQQIREGINQLSKDKNLLYTKNQDTQIVFDKHQIRKIIQGILIKIADDFANKRTPYFCFKTHSIGNCVFKDGILQLKPPSEAQYTKISYGKSSSRIKFNLMLFVLHKVKSLLDTNTKLTKREIYYQLKIFVRGQGFIDRALHAVSALLQVGLHAINITAQKGLVFGNLKILLSSGECINCNVPGTLIPQDIDDIVEIHSKAYFIFVVEKESIFYKLLEEDLPNRLTRPFIMITGKGFPDLNTQLFIKKLWMVMSIPVLIFVDADPDGINIMLNYRFGSVSNAHISHCLAIPNARWLGVFPSDIERFDMTKQCLTQREVSKIKQLLKLPYLSKYPEICEQLRILLDRNYKAGIEGLFVTDNFLSKVYLPSKFYSNELI